MTIQQNPDGSLYIHAIIKDCEYGQVYRNLTEDKAIARFEKMVELFQNGQDLKVLRGDF